MVNKDIVEIFKSQKNDNEIGFKAHPVWILLGDLEESISIAEEMVESVREFVSHYDAMSFELQKSNLQQLNNFLSLHSFDFKIATCIIRSVDDVINSAILKKIEDVNLNTVFIIVAQNISPTLYSRGIVFKVQKSPKIDEKCLKLLDKYPGFTDFIDPLVNYDELPDTINHWLEHKIINSIRNKDINTLSVEYESWKKFVDINNWIKSGQLNKSTATEMMLSILGVAGIAE